MTSEVQAKTEDTHDKETLDMPAQSISSQDVIDFLQKNPDFIIQNSELLSQLEGNDENGQAISFTQRQISALRNEKTQLNEKLIHLIDTAKENENLYTQTRKLIIDILKQPSLESLSDLISHQLPAYYTFSASKLILFSEKLPSQHVHSLEDARSQIDSLLSNESVVCGALRDHELEFLFADKKDTVKSAAVAPLFLQNNDSADEAKHLLGLLVLGSSNEDHFKAGSETTLIDFLCDVLSLSLQQYT